MACAGAAQKGHGPAAAGEGITDALCGRLFRYQKADDCGTRGVVLPRMRLPASGCPNKRAFQFPYKVWANSLAGASLALQEHADGSMARTPGIGRDGPDAEQIDAAVRGTTYTLQTEAERCKVRGNGVLVMRANIRSRLRVKVGILSMAEKGGQVMVPDRVRTVRVYQRLLCRRCCCCIFLLGHIPVFFFINSSVKEAALPCCRGSVAQYRYNSPADAPLP